MLSPAPNFDRIAPWYDTLKGLVFGAALDQAVEASLSWVPAGSRVLVAGGGTGRSLLPALLARQPRHIHYLEAAAAMLSRAQAVAPVAAITWQVATARDLPPDLRVDVVITPFLLDVFTPVGLATEASLLAAALRPGGRWLVTDFCLPGGWRRLPSRGLLALMYSFFRLTAGIPARRLPPWEAWFQAQGYPALACQDRLGGLIRSCVWERPSG